MPYALTYGIGFPSGKEIPMLGIIANHVARPLTVDEIKAVADLLNATTTNPSHTPKPKYRPWHAHEVPVGAAIRFHNRSGTWLIWHCSPNGGIAIMGERDHDPQTILNQCTHSIDGCKTWHPCGVEVGINAQGGAK